MATYKAPLREIDFVLREVLGVGRLAELPGFEEATPEFLGGVLDEAAKLIETELAPLSARGDAQGCRWQDGEVIVPDGFAEAYKLYWEAGWVGLSNPTDWGGQGLPYTVSKVVEEMTCSANVAFTLYPGLTTSCFEALLANASEADKAKYLSKLGTGEWTGAMCLTEPQAGSDLAAVKCKATPRGDGRYSIEGNKIFITAGEHGMAENIVHFVLARLADAPPGVRGLSTFIVPKYLVNEDGSLGERNQFRCVSIEHKMGIHGSATCTMQFDGAVGTMVGEPNTGIRNMFVMMNLARIMVGVQGLGQCELATQNAIAYALERKQGKALTGGNGDDVAIVEHPDVRRMLLTMKAITEGARVLAYETAMFVDLSRRHPDAAVRAEAQDSVELNTPLVKAFCTDAAFELAGLAVQVYGGHGFIREHGIEQIVRDSKILSLYEGTNGIQAMDLVRRKLFLNGGRLPERFFAAVRAQLDGDAAVGHIVRPLTKAVDALEQTTRWLQESFHSDPNAGGFGAAEFLRAFALTYLGYNWLRMAKAARRLEDGAYRSAKLVTARFFAERLLTQVPLLCENVRQGPQAEMSLPAEAFVTA